jgi:ATP-dependent Clp protease protease subunit
MRGRLPYHQPPDPDRDATPGPLDGVSPWLQERLFDRRIVMLSGYLNATAASHVTAALVTLEVAGPEPIQLHVSAADGELSSAFAIVDAIEAIAAPVHAIVPAQAGGAVLAVLAAAARRLAYPHARIRLAEPRTAVAAGTADKVAAAAGEYLRELEELIVRLAAVTGRPRSQVEDDLSAGRVLSAAEAKEYGLIDDIVGSART